MITAEEAKELTANWVTYELREIEPIIRQVAVKGNKLCHLQTPYHNSTVNQLVKELEKSGFTVIKRDYSNTYTSLVLRW